jgi:hypothetical protein
MTRRFPRREERGAAVLTLHGTTDLQMTIRQSIVTLVIVGAFMIGRAIYGDRVVVGYFLLIGIIGAVAIVLLERRRSRLNRLLSVLPEDVRDSLLVVLENSEIRGIAVADAGLRGPRVPLRGDVEQFAYPSSHARTMAWTTNIWSFLGGLFLLGYLSDRALGHERFFYARDSWWYVAGIAAMCVAGAAGSWWCKCEAQAVVRVTDERLTLEVPGRRTRSVAWSDVREVQIHSLSRGLKVRGADARIGAGSQIVGYGRLLNLVLTRVPPSTRVRAA